MKYICEECGKEYSAMPSKARRFCSKLCFQTHMRRVMGALSDEQ